MTQFGYNLARYGLVGLWRGVAIAIVTTACGNSALEEANAELDDALVRVDSLETEISTLRSELSSRSAEPIHVETTDPGCPNAFLAQSSAQSAADYAAKAKQHLDDGDVELASRAIRSAESDAESVVTYLMGCI